jgi:hypothetical protein
LQPVIIFNESELLMKYRLLLLAMIVLALVLAACAPPPQLRDETLLADTSLVSGEPCEAPCWRGITPGETAWRDAMTILEDDAELENVQTQEDEQTDAIGAVWQPKGGTQCCQMVAEDGETVNLIFLRTKPEMSLSEVIDAHGEPTYAVGTPVTDDQAIVNLIYPDLPMIVLAFAPGPEGEVSEDSEVVGVFYTTPDDMELFLQTNYLHDWSGYGAFSEYTNAEGAEFEVTPSVTLTPTPGS